MDTKKLLTELIKIKSTEKASANYAIKYCYNYLLENGLSSKIIENNGYKSLICEIGSGEKTIILNGHLDVVEADKEQFEPYEYNGRIYGRGSADMKGAVAAMIDTMIEIKDINLPCNVQLQLVSDEETGGENCSKYLAENGYRGDFVICGEPTNLEIGIQAKGILQIDITVQGKSAHSSRPWEGENAILKACDIFNAIKKLPFTTQKSEFYEGPSINLSKIEGGNIYNKVPDLCKMGIDIRFLPGQNPEKILSQIESVAGKNVKIHSYGDAVVTKPDDEYVKKLKSIISNHINTTVKIFGQHGSADTKFFSKYNIPAVEFGPIGANWHGKDEYIEIESINTYKKILKDFIFSIK
ncbi:M20 family metallopeptidase [Thermoanaerobacter uzonensis]|uniref:M20 family metallopeptidase n=1 Tax=Thermoanaerobacter uzonensis TaxID=447593 RepID=UPI003D7686C6